MAVSFKEEKKKQKLLILVIIIVIIITVFILWFGILKDKKSSSVIEIRPANLIREISIDFNVLNNDIFEKIKPFEVISKFDGEKGRTNPFLPY